jgi:hypothetical protein
MSEIVDTRVNGMTGESPIKRFRRNGERALQPVNGSSAVPATCPDLVCRVHPDCAIEADTNSYSVRPGG